MKSLYIFFTLLLLCLTGCATTQPAKVVTKTNVELIATPADLLLICQVTEPPNRDNYLLLSAREKEEVLTNYSGKLLKDLSLCNIQISSIKRFQELQLQELKKKKDGP